MAMHTTPRVFVPRAAFRPCGGGTDGADVRSHARQQANDWTSKGFVPCDATSIGLGERGKRAP